MKISTVELDNAFRQEVNRLRQMLGGQIDAEQAKALGLVNQTLDQLIQRTLLSLAADDAGLRVGDPLVLGQLGAEPAFRNQLGQFDPDQFRRVLAANQLTEDGYVNYSAPRSSGPNWSARSRRARRRRACWSTTCSAVRPSGESPKPCWCRTPPWAMSERRTMPL